ncbi:DUF1365 domain-containing protein [Streptomyces sp. TRM66268-LWL]|uniref:DUF1365 domain-containing protein n=1 Tax=Streptomyces polyasparticus TaxID=2767826 RepID=A0ABR7SXC0_9ACTN|nr:DUF1365 domain-containing protein [Streptomyces polyasparticus]MBC9719262.1 DUF1365 domain-containing protein [Streptomyces polyasparticus]
MKCSAAALYPSVITHVRTEPRRYTLKHRTYLWLVDLDRLPVLPRPLRPLARFDGRDHFAGRAGSIRAGLETFLAAEGVDLAGGQVLMLGHARVLGHVFNPLTLFWCYGPNGELRCVVAEVHNTYGERHSYLLHPDGDTGAGPTAEYGVAKEFYVSPFFPVDGDYRMRLPAPDQHLRVTVHLERAGARPFTATVRGERIPVTYRTLLSALARHPWPTLAVSAAIRRHGIRLWLRGLPVQPRPPHTPQRGMQ